MKLLLFQAKKFYWASFSKTLDEASEQEVADIVAFLESLEGEFPEISLPRLPSRSGKSILEDQAPAAKE